jgi:hypothetical protein
MPGISGVLVLFTSLTIGIGVGYWMDEIDAKSSEIVD